MTDVHVLCGAEEPLRPNRQLLALDEDSGDIRLAEYVEAGLNRYCFVETTGATDAQKIIATIFSRIVAAQQLAPTTFVIWRTAGQGVSPVRCRVLASRLTKAGWTITCRDTMCVAAQELRTAQITALRPLDSDDRCSGWIVVFGSDLRAETFLSPPFLASLAVLSRTHLLYPSREFIEGLKTHRLGIAYEGRDSLGRHGLVVVMPADIQTVLTRLVRDGLLAEIRRGDTAHSVWIQPPHVDPARER